jgi:hypothetical protein
MRSFEDCLFVISQSPAKQNQDFSFAGQSRVSIASTYPNSAVQAAAKIAA